MQLFDDRGTDKIVIHSHIKGEKKISDLQHAKEISDLIDESFRLKGIDKIYTWATTDEEYRYNLFLGYNPTGMEVVQDDYNGPSIYEFEKEL